MTAAVVIGGQPPQLDEFEAQCLEVRDVAVQCGAVGHRTASRVSEAASTVLSGSSASISAGVSRPEIRKA
jgi:hypothetical protein